MTALPDIKRMTDGLAEMKVSDAEFCRRAEINVTTWGRWKRGEFMPSMRLWTRVVAEFDALKDERDARRDDEGAAA